MKKNNKKICKMNQKILLILSLIILITVVVFGYGIIKTYKANQHYLLGVAYENQGYYDTAIKSFETSVKLRPNSIVYNALGNLNYNMGNSVSAINAYNEGIKVDKNDIENMFDLGIVYIDIQEYDNAKQALNKILEQNKDSSSTYALFGTINIELGKWDEAKLNLEKSLDLQKRASTYNDLGVVYENTGEIDKAIENYQIALKYDPQYALAKNNLERVLT